MPNKTILLKSKKTKKEHCNEIILKKKEKKMNKMEKNNTEVK